MSLKASGALDDEKEENQTHKPSLQLPISNVIVDSNATKCPSKPLELSEKPVTRKSNRWKEAQNR